MDNELLLLDRIEVIKQINEKYDLEHNAYISFSGGKDSTILHYLIDMALPGNRIPRVFINTGIEYVDIVNFVKDLASNDDRFILIKPTQAIKPMLEKYGYPFKSKQHSHYLSIYQHSGRTALSVKRYLGDIESTTLFKCPKSLYYQFTDRFKIKVSELCCNKLKKDVAIRYEKQSNRPIAILGLMQDEGGQRASHKGCVIFSDNDNKILKKFKPLNPLTQNFEKWFIDKYHIQLCKLYYPPFNFKRTGCKGCPYSLDLQEQLDIMEKYLPNERKQCEMIWQPIYEEYRRIGYRLKPHKQLDLFEFEGD